MRFSLAIFDFDGTLADTRRTIVETMFATMSELGIEKHTESEIAATIGLPLEGSFRVLYPNGDEVFIANCAATYRRIFEANRIRLTPPLFPGVLDALGALRKRGIQIAIASSRSTRSLLDFGARLGLAELVSTTVGATDVTHHKPHPETVLKILAVLGVDAADTIVIGDMPVDIEMGRRAGCATCGVTWGNETRAELESAGADKVIDNIKE